MASFFRDTAFGWTFRTLSGGRLFAWDEYKDHDLVERYLSASQPANSRQVVEQDKPDKQEEKADDSESVKDDGRSTHSDVESAIDVQLVDWLENDPAVCRSNLVRLAARLMQCQLETHELVKSQEVLCDFSDLPPHYFRLYRLRYIYFWHRWH